MAESTQEPRRDARLVLPNAKVTGRRLGEGPYGCVEVLEVGGLFCAGKNFRESLICSSKEQGVGRTVEERYDACARYLSDLRHPNIVQFLGICFLENEFGPPRPMLVTEQLQCSLDDLLESTRGTIPLAKKCSILQDVARGLVYLHGHSPAVVHKDLTAKNVLLNTAMVAKIGDMGNSHMFSDQPGQLVNVMRSDNDVRVYMPPEVFDDPPRYGPEMDMFSFGHLTLFTVIQVFPDRLQSLPSGCHDEVMKRTKYMDAMKRNIGDSHALVQLCAQCLEYAPDARPSASEVLQRIQSISSQENDGYHNMTRLHLQKLVKENEEKERKLQEENVRLEEQITLLEEQLKPPQGTEREQNHSDLEMLKPDIIKEVCLHSAPSKEPTPTQSPSVSTQAPPEDPSSTGALSNEKEMPSKTPSTWPKTSSKSSFSTKSPSNAVETSSQAASSTKNISKESTAFGELETCPKVQEMKRDPEDSRLKTAEYDMSSWEVVEISELKPDITKEACLHSAPSSNPTSTQSPSVSIQAPSTEPSSTETPSNKHELPSEVPKEPASTVPHFRQTTSTKTVSSESEIPSQATKTPSKGPTSLKTISKGPEASLQNPSSSNLKTTSKGHDTPSKKPTVQKKSASTKAPIRKSSSTAKNGEISHKLPTSVKRMETSSARSTVTPSTIAAPASTNTPTSEPQASSKGPSSSKVQPETAFRKSAPNKTPSGGGLKAASNLSRTTEGRYGREQPQGRYGGRREYFDDAYRGPSHGRGRGYSEDGYGGLSYGGRRGHFEDGYGSSSYGGGRISANDESRLRIQAATRRMEESSERALKTTNETVQLGQDIINNMDRQTEALDRTERRLDEMNVTLDQRKGRQQTKSLFSEVPTRNGSFRGPRPETTPPPSLAHLPSTGSAVVDRNLDEMSEKLHVLKGMAEHMGEQLDHTTAQAGRIQHKSHQTDHKMRENIKRYL